MRVFLQTLFFIFHFITMTQATPLKLENTTAELLSEVKQIKPGKPFWVVLRLTMKPGWHTYWINPGDSGMATQIDWELPAGFQASTIQWLAPQHLPFGRLVNFGYTNDSYHLVQITPPHDLGGTPQTLTAKAQWLVCETTCIPESGDLTLTLPVHTGDGENELSEHQPLIHQLRGELPIEISTSGQVALADSTITLDIKAPELKELTPSSVYFYPQDTGVIKSASPQEWTLKDGKATGTVVHDFNPLPQTLHGILQIHDETKKKIHNYQLTFKEIAPLPTPTVALDSMGIILLFALLGGIILNAMPCVFPILSLKALSIVKQKDSSYIRREGFAYTGGVVVSFLLLAGLLIMIQQAGHAIGWGFQMQSPLFVGAMIYLMFVMGLSLSGYFYVPFIGTISSSDPHQKSLINSFWVGVLAVLVATPCTAPFMGVALGYALSQPMEIVLLVFLALALGFALPYLFLSLFPILFRLLPKPGAWMETLKEFLAFPMYATVVWLLWVLIQQSGSRGFILVGGGLVLTSFSLWLYKHLQERLRPIKYLLGTFLIFLSLSPLLYLHEGPAQDFPVMPFSKSTLDELRGQGKPVFVNATAAWCITCKFNELVLKSETITKIMKQKGIVFLEADWTNQDASISNYLKTFGRNGVPLYIFYPSKGEPVILPQLLTESILSETFVNQPDLQQGK